VNAGVDGRRDETTDAMLYLGRDALGDADPAALERELGEPAASRLRLRTGAGSTLLVYPGGGVAFGTDGSVVEILELFPPTTLQRYLDDVYEEPPAFIR
jgi:hypothetical protein